jgi:bifunctional UDP-N-acetylglucosamine pyrophosphorylase / glucosamine-1-phosphate N-acetyltransferase
VTNNKKRSLSAVVLAAGRSTRFRGTRPKVLHPVVGRTIISHILETLRGVHRSIRLSDVCLVVPPGKQIEKALAAEKYPFKLKFAVQSDPQGTGDATQIGLRKLGRVSDVLVLAGDMPLISSESLVGLVSARREAGAAVAVLTAIDGPPAYGRVMRSGERITGVVEARDATPDELDIREVNTSTYAFGLEQLEAVLPRLGKDNAQAEYYLTDAVGSLTKAGELVVSMQAPPEEVVGTNTRYDFANVARLARERLVGDLMNNGVTVIDPDTTYVDAGVVVGPDTVLLPNTFLEGSTKIGAGCEIGPNTRLVDTHVGDEAIVTFAVAREARIGAGATVGPFASLRPGTNLAKGAHVGTFAEMKNAKIGERTKVPHFSYLGDVTIGRDSNIAAGTITSNYDGKDKHATRIGDEVFIGSDSILVAPVRVGSRAYTGAGSVVTRDVKAGDLVYGVPASTKKRVPKARKAAKPKAKRPVRKAATSRKSTAKKKGRGK